MRNSNIQQVNERLSIIEKKLDMIEKVIHAAFAANKSLAAAVIFQGLMEMPSFKRLLDKTFSPRDDLNV